MMCNQELEFPLACHIKVIANDRPDMHDKLNAALLACDRNEKLEKGRKSSSGSYRTFNLSATVDSKEILTQIDDALRAVDGVRMVL